VFTMPTFACDSPWRTSLIESDIYGVVEAGM
jgi:hypothetical protein